MEMARQSGFYRRLPRKLTLEALVQGLLDLACVGTAQTSLRHLSLRAGLACGIVYSKQAMAKRLNAAVGDFMRRVLDHVIARHLQCRRRPLLQGFARVLVADSTVVSLHPKLAPLFSGSANQAGHCYSALKIQAVYDFSHERLVDLSLSGFRRNDQAASGDILAHARRGDLLLRDLGYFVLEVLATLEQRGIDWISRLDPQVSLLDPQTGQPIDLLYQLRRHGHWDSLVLLGRQHQIPVRIVAAPVPEAVANQRRRKAKANRDRRCRPNARRLELLGWQVMITSVCASKLKPQEIFAAYGLRWRIETLFKAYKQYFRLGDLAGSCANLVIALAYAKLILITRFHQIVAQSIPYEQTQYLSVYKLAQLFCWTLQQMRPAPSKPALLIEQIRYHARYESRSRPNFLQCAYSLG